MQSTSLYGGMPPKFPTYDALPLRQGIKKISVFNYDIFLIFFIRAVKMGPFFILKTLSGQR